MRQRDALVAYLATLLAAVVVIAIAAFLAFHRRYSEALGIGGVVMGLIGVLGGFRPRMPPSPEARP